MSEEQLRQLQRQLWNIADTLRGKMNADEFRDYILGFIFYKYLSEKVVGYANQFILSEDGLDYAQLNEQDEEGAEIVEIVKDSLLNELDYFLKPSELFGAIALRSKSDSKGQGWRVYWAVCWGCGIRKGMNRPEYFGGSLSWVRPLWPTLPIGDNTPFQIQQVEHSQLSWANVDG